MYSSIWTHMTNEVTLLRVSMIPFSYVQYVELIHLTSNLMCFIVIVCLTHVTCRLGVAIMEQLPACRLHGLVVYFTVLMNKYKYYKGKRGCRVRQYK